jgi:hypothetical protein
MAALIAIGITPARMALAKAVLGLEVNLAQLASAEYIAGVAEDGHLQALAARYFERLQALAADLERDMGAAVPTPGAAT